jgi:hypothetical protein
LFQPGYENLTELFRVFLCQHHLASLDQPKQVLEDFVLWLFGSLSQVGEGELLLAVKNVGLEVIAEEGL